MTLDFTRLVRPGDTVTWTQGAGEPTGLIADLMRQRHAIGPFRVFLAGSYVGSVRLEHADVVSIAGLGAVGTNRALCDAGAMDIIPCHLSDVPRLLRPDVVLTQLAAGDGYSFGTTNGFVAGAIPGARVVVAEVNDRAPWTYSRHSTVDRVDVTVPVSRPPIELPARAPTPEERAIAAHIAAFVADGATVQLGIGGVPAAVADALRGRRRLRVHSGVVGDAIVDLVEAGIADAPVVAGALLGTRRLYGFAHEHPGVLVEPVAHTHDHAVLRALTGLVAINSAIEVDLTGQVGAEIAGTRYVGTSAATPTSRAGRWRRRAGARSSASPRARPRAPRGSSAACVPGRSRRAAPTPTSSSPSTAWPSCAAGRSRSACGGWSPSPTPTTARRSNARSSSAHVRDALRTRLWFSPGMPTRAPSEDEAGTPRRAVVQSVGRAFEILEILKDATVPMSALELARATGLDRTVVHRLLRTLSQHGMTIEERGTFRLGPSSVLLAHRYLDNLLVRRLALPYLLDIQAGDLAKSRGRSPSRSPSVTSRR